MKKSTLTEIRRILGKVNESLEPDVSAEQVLHLFLSAAKRKWPKARLDGHGKVKTAIIPVEPDSSNKMSTANVEHDADSILGHITGWKRQRGQNRYVYSPGNPDNGPIAYIDSFTDSDGVDQVYLGLDHFSTEESTSKTEALELNDAMFDRFLDGIIKNATDMRKQVDRLGGFEAGKRRGAVHTLLTQTNEITNLSRVLYRKLSEHA